MIVFAPVFISLGKHVIEDIPQVLSIPASRSSVFRIVNGAKRMLAVSDTIGADEGLATIIERRVLSSI